MKDKRDNSYYVELAMIIGKKSALLILAITSFAVVYQFANSYTANHIASPLFRALANSAIVFFAYIVIDWLLDQVGTFVSNEAFSGQWQGYTTEKRRYIRMLGFFALCLLVVTSTMSIWQSGEITYGIVGDSDTRSIETTIQETVHSNDKLLTSIDKDLRDARRSESSRIRKAEREGDKAFREIYQSGTYHQRKAWDHGRSWLMSLKGKAHKSTIAWRDQLLEAQQAKRNAIQKEKDLVESLMNQKTMVLASITSDTTVSTLSLSGAKIIEQHNKRFEGVTKAIITLEISMGIIAALLFYFHSRHKKFYGSQIEEDQGGIVKTIIGLFKTIKGIFRIVGDKINQRTTKQFNISIAGVAGSVPVDADGEQRNVPGNASHDEGNVSGEREAEEPYGKRMNEKRSSKKPEKTFPSRLCLNCDTEFVPKREKHSFCKSSCRTAHWKAENNREPFFKKKKS